MSQLPAPDTSAAFFERLYRRREDPWSFATSHYERGRFSALIDALGGRRFQAAFEPGCATGVLTARLATRCNHVEAIDLSPTAVSRARARCQSWAHVHVHQGPLAEYRPAVALDLLVLSECGYYLSRPALGEYAAAISTHLQPGATILAGHWLGQSDDHVLGGHEVHDLLGQTPGWIPELDTLYATRCRISRWRFDRRDLARG